ncbi:MAG: U32 family peptidase [Mycoplasmoidaceae bacterium]|nr:U32 family peptidase [Mycoplasmoidaceae bacterium]
MSAKDMNQVTNIPKLIEAGIDSFKIEGRMKSEYYIATVVNTYKKIIDEYYENHNIKDFSIYEKEIKNAENRKTSYG